MNKKMMREDDDIENMGIMQGFMDSMADEGDDEGEGPSGEAGHAWAPDLGGIFGLGRGCTR